MKFFLPLAISSLLAAAANCLAATTIQIDAKFADVAPDTEIPAKPESLAKAKGINVLSAPCVVTEPGKAATIEVTQNLAAPDASEVPLGVSLSVKPTLTEKGGIAFTGKATDRFKHGQRDGESLTVLSCVAREMYFKGTVASGSTVLIKGGPSTSSAAKKDGATQVKSRELVIYLTFKKVTPEPEKRPTPKKKPGTSPSKESPKKKKPSSN